jgi:hypothetical protein
MGLFLSGGTSPLTVPTKEDLHVCEITRYADHIFTSLPNQELGPRCVVEKPAFLPRICELPIDLRLASFMDRGLGWFSTEFIASDQAIFPAQELAFPF